MTRIISESPLAAQAAPGFHITPPRGRTRESRSNYYNKWIQTRAQWPATRKRARVLRWTLQMRAMALCKIRSDLILCVLCRLGSPNFAQRHRPHLQSPSQHPRPLPRRRPLCHSLNPLIVIIGSALSCSTVRTSPPPNARL